MQKEKVDMTIQMQGMKKRNKSRNLAGCIVITFNNIGKTVKGLV